MNENQTDIGELIEPAPVSFSFDTPGWHVVGGLIVLLVLIITYLLWRRHVRNRYRRTALQHIQQLETKITDQQLLVYEVNMLLKRIALRFVDRDEVAHLRGAAWLEFLNTASRHKLFTNDMQKAIESVYTSGSDKTASDSFIISAKKWISVHAFSKRKPDHTTKHIKKAA